MRGALPDRDETVIQCHVGGVLTKLRRFNAVMLSRTAFFHMIPD